MNGADTFDAALILTGIVFWFWVAGLVMEGRLRNKWRKIKRHRVRR